MSTHYGNISYEFSSFRFLVAKYEQVIYKSTSSWGDKRERLYTAITRAKKKCIVYEVGSSVKDCIRASPALRKTFLFK